MNALEPIISHFEKILMLIQSLEGDSTLASSKEMEEAKHHLISFLEKKGTLSSIPSADIYREIAEALHHLNPFLQILQNYKQDILGQVEKSSSFNRAVTAYTRHTTPSKGSS